MSASLKIDTKGLQKIIARLDDPSIKAQLENLPQEKAIAAMVGQAIAENFENEGPGWAPLKAATIRQSVSKKLRKHLAAMTDEELLKHEAKARKLGVGPNRKILQKTGLLKKSVTIPNFAGSGKNVVAKNIYRTEGKNLVWGTDLIYAGVHNKGLPSKNIPKREFLRIPDQWMRSINDFVIGKVLKIVKQSLGTKTK